MASATEGFSSVCEVDATKTAVIVGPALDDVFIAERGWFAVTAFVVLPRAPPLLSLLKIRCIMEVVVEFVGSASAASAAVVARAGFGGGDKALFWFDAPPFADIVDIDDRDDGPPPTAPETVNRVVGSAIAIVVLAVVVTTDVDVVGNVVAVISTLRASAKYPFMAVSPNADVFTVTRTGLVSSKRDINSLVDAGRSATVAGNS